MSTLRQADLAAVLEAAWKTRQVDDLGELPRQLLEIASSLVPADVASYNEVAGDGGVVAVSVPEDPLTPSTAEAFARYAHQNPLIASYSRSNGCAPLRLSDFLTSRELHNLELYQEVYRPAGVERQIAVRLPSPPGVVLGVALNRARRDFSEREREMLTLLAPHFGRTHADASLRSLLTAAELVEEPLDGGTRSVVALDSRLRMKATDGRAWVLLKAYFDETPPVRTGQLPETLARWLRNEQQAADLLGATRSASPVLVAVRPGGKLRVRLIRRPYADASDLVLLTEVSVPDEPAHAAALTPRELEVLRLVAEGQTSVRIAATLGVSERTVHKHLENAYRKLGVASRAGAIRALRDRLF